MTLKQQLLEELIAIRGEQHRVNLEKYTERELALILDTYKQFTQEQEEKDKKTSEDAFSTGKARLIEVVRSYSRTDQIEQYKPLSIFQSLKAEIYDINVLPAVASRLHRDCQRRVDVDLQLEKNRLKPKPKFTDVHDDETCALCEICELF